MRTVGAQQKDHPFGKMRQRGPNFVAIDNPLVAFALCKGLYTGKIRTGPGLAKTLAPDILARKQAW